ncbi:MAG: hypothetical protein KDE00_12030 [Rhodobacteraceae bacterium]|nr:hypothetical protein [Paracoccaceae bacterium]
MTEHDTATNTLEQTVARKRAHLADTVEELRGRMSSDALAREALGMIRSNAASYSRSIDQAVRANPLALAVTGVGLAWLIFGGRRPAAQPSATSVARWEDEGGAPLPEDAPAADMSGADSVWVDRVDALRSVASSALRRLERDARDAVGGVRDLAAERAQILSSFTEDMRGALRDGLDGLSEGASDRIVQLREAAYGARLRMQDKANASAREIGRAATDHPMIAGGVALALGAALATALPRTRMEDRTFGAESDRMMRRAAELLAEERARIATVAEGVRTDAQGAIRDVAATAARKVGEIGERALERADEGTASV